MIVLLTLFGEWAWGWGDYSRASTNPWCVVILSLSLLALEMTEGLGTVFQEEVCGQE